MERTAYYIRNNNPESEKYLKVSNNGQYGTRYSLIDDFFIKTVFDSAEDAKLSAMTYIRQHQKCKVTDLSVVECIIREEALDVRPLAPDEYIIYPLAWGKEAEKVIDDDNFLLKCFVREFKTSPKSFDKELWVHNYAEIHCYNIVW